MEFFFVKRILCGRFRACKSVSSAWRSDDEEVERRRRAVFGFSTAWGSCFAIARLARAFLGLLW